MRKIFIWEEDEQEQDTLIALLQDEYRVVAIREEEALRAALRKGAGDLIVLGITENVMDRCLTVLGHLRVLAPGTPILCRLPHGDPGVPTALLRQGVSACISRSCSRQELKFWLRELRAPSTPQFSVAEASPPFRDLAAATAVPALLGESESIRQVRSQIELYAHYDFPVLLTGECGTGKELAARSLHRHSGRAASTFLAINCGALPETILESELFGTEKGAYTGAVSRPGCFELANRGTLFLDEITELVPGAQAKLLRALEGGEVRRLGARKTMHCDVRLISATNVNLEVEEGFRYDLLERLETLMLEMPPLRKRREDIAILSRYFLESFSMNVVLGEKALSKLEEYDWPGNVRQLRNATLRAAVLAAGSASKAPAVIHPEHVVFGRRPVGC